MDNILGQMRGRNMERMEDSGWKRSNGEYGADEDGEYGADEEWMSQGMEG